MFVRIATIQGAERKTDAAVEFIEETGRPALEASAGNQGVAVMVDAEAGRTVVASYWDGTDTMLASESALASLRGQAAAVGGGDLTVENYEVAVAERVSVPPAGAAVRLLRAQGDPGATDELVAFYRAEALPVFLGIPGLCGVQLLVDRSSGAAISATAWTDAAALHAAQAQLRAAAAKFTERFGDRVTGIEGYTMVRTTFRLP